MGTSQRQRNTDCRFRSAIKRCSVAAPQGTYTRTQSAVSRRAPLERPAPCKILLGCPCGRKLMNKHPELATAMLAVAFCAVLLVTGLADAECWEHLAELELSSRFRECNVGSSTSSLDLAG